MREDGNNSLTTVTNRVRWIVARQFGEPVNAIVESTHFVTDLHCDEVDLAEVVMAAEDEFGLKIENHEFAYLETVRELIDLVLYKSQLSATEPPLLQKNCRLHPLPRRTGRVFDYCPVVSVIGITICASVLLLTSAIKDRPVERGLIAVLALAILLVFSTVVARAYFKILELRRWANSPQPPAAETKSRLHLKMNPSLIAAIFVPAFLGALLTLVFLSNLPDWIVWPLAIACGSGFIGFLGFRYAQNRMLLVITFAGVGCLAKGGLGATISFKAVAPSLSSDGFPAIVEFLLSTSSPVADVALIFAGTLLLIIAFSLSRRHS